MTSIPYTAGHAERHVDTLPRAAWNRATWGPIMMGAVVAIGLQFIFTVLGIAIGISSADAGAGSGNGADPQTISVAAGAWWLITGTIAILIGGFVLGRTAGLPRVMQLHLGAVAMWAVVALFGFLVIWSGAGMASEVTSPLAMNAGGNGFSANGAADAVNRTLGTQTQAAGSAEAARDAAQTASWWSVIGLLAGVAAAIAGAIMGVPAGLVPEENHRR